MMRFTVRSPTGGFGIESDNVPIMSQTVCIQFVPFEISFLSKVTKNKYQRTNGPVNAHLRPEIYTNKLV